MSQSSSTGTPPNFDYLSGSERNRDRVRRVEQSFDCDCDCLQLDRRGRVLLAQGVLLKICRGQLKLCYIFLFNDLLVYGSARGPNSCRLCKQRVLELWCLMVLQPESKPCDFQVISPKKSLFIRANTPQEAAKWVDRIRMCTARCSFQRPVFSNFDLNPVWIPDSMYSACMQCSQKFHVFNRKHHCRHCGNLVCGSCSEHRWLLPSQGSKPQRICLSCHVLLTSGRQRRITDQTSAGDSSSDTATVDDQPQLPRRPEDDRLLSQFNTLRVNRGETFFDFASHH